MLPCLLVILIVTLSTILEMVNDQMIEDREEMEEIIQIEVVDRNSIRIRIQVCGLMVIVIKIMKGA